METIQVCLPKKYLQRIDKEVKEGRYKNRSEAVGDYIDRLHFLSGFREFQGLVEDDEVDKKELMEMVKEERSRVHRRYFGE